MKSSKVIPFLMLVFVGAVSEPKLSVVPGVGRGVTLQCEANCWFPEPEVTFVDAQGNSISAENPKRDQDSRGCFTVTRRVTVQTAPNRFNFSLLLKHTLSTKCLFGSYTCAVIMRQQSKIENKRQE